ncbi:MAG: DUF4299 domain-containing protein [Ruminococcus sp.]|nr:DUF4299 domain-containing protein [Ruminococcus sp.]
MSAFYTVTRKDDSSDFHLDIRKFIGEYGCGVYRMDRLCEQYPEDDDELIVYDKNGIGRGVSVSLADNGFELRMLIPSPRSDVNLLFELIRRLCEQAGDCAISDEEEQVFLSDIPRKNEGLIDASRRALMQFCDTYKTHEGCLSFYSAKYPLDFNAAMLERIFSSEDPLKTFGDILHKLQSNPADRPPAVFLKARPKPDPENSDNTLQRAAGVFTVTLGESLILPLNPHAPPGLSDEKHTPLEVSGWYALGYNAHERSVIGAAKYEDFLSAVSGTASPFDGTNIVIQPISHEKAKKIFTGDKSIIFK